METGRARVVGVWFAAVVIAIAIIGFESETRAEHDGPEMVSDFSFAAPRGFGDQRNSWAQSMVWWRDHLYVGTGRDALCTSLFSIWRFASGLFGLDFANTFLPYPPNDVDFSCEPNGADLPLQAEIWRWAPESDSWARVFQSPLDLDNPGPPPQPGKKLPYEITFRGMTPHEDPDGTSALYAFGVSAGVMWDNSRIPPPRILRSVDGLTWTPVPQTPGTFLGDLPFSADHTSFRSPVSFGGKLFVLSGPIFGQGSLIASADPARGDDAWFLAAPVDLVFYEMAEFNGWLYVGTFNPIGGGYSVLKTRAQGQPPYRFQTVVPIGAYHPDPVRASRSVVSMNIFQGRLYVGTATQTEVLRINPDDTWDLVVGPPRQAPAVNGGVEWKYPISGLDSGFGHTLNDHAWQMADISGSLYIGTYNASVGSRNHPEHGPKLLHNMGAHLYRSSDGWYQTAITTDGFANLGDPRGGRYDYGIRTMAVTPYGAFFGTANDFYGLAILRMAIPNLPALPAPRRLEIEPIVGDAALLSWRGSPGDRKYEVWRAQRFPIQVRTEINIEAWNVLTGDLIPDVYIGPYERIATTDQTTFVDDTVAAGVSYMYYVQHVKGDRVSPQSNLVAFPLLLPPMTFAQLEHELDKMDARGRLKPQGQVRLRRQILAARDLAASCRIEEAIELLKSEGASRWAYTPESVDVEVMLAKLARRLRLYQSRPLEIRSSEFCSQ